MLSTILPLTLTLILTLLHTTLTTALTTNFTLLNLTHIPTSATAPHIHNGSISFVLLATTDYSTHYCSRTFITPNELDASGGPFACNDEWQDLLFYWRKGSSAPANGTDDAGVVELDIWFAYLDCRSVLRIISPGKKKQPANEASGPTTGGAVSESGTLALPPPSRVNAEEGDLSQVWDVVFVPVQTASSSAFFPGEFEEVCVQQYR